MPSPYSYELRVRVIKAVESGMSISKIKEVFRVSRDTVYKWKAIKEGTGDVRAKTGYQKGFSRMIVKDLSAFKLFIDEHKDKSLRELAELYPIPISQSTVANYISRIGYTYKKSLLSSSQRYSSKV
jgi:transposase